MTAIIISNSPQYTFGTLTNRMVSGIISANTSMQRLQDAVATATSGYSGEPGTQFEIPANFATGPSLTQMPNLFGVIADPDSPGAQGQAYAYALGQLNQAWEAFWTAAQQYVEALDNGSSI